MILLRLHCASFWVDVRLREINGRWIASADTPDGPSLGLGKGAIEAVEYALVGDTGVHPAPVTSWPLRIMRRDLWIRGAALAGAWR